MQHALFWEGNHFSGEINSTCGTRSANVSQLGRHLFLYMCTGNFDKKLEVQYYLFKRTSNCCSCLVSGTRL